MEVKVPAQSALQERRGLATRLSKKKLEYRKRLAVKHMNRQIGIRERKKSRLAVDILLINIPQPVA